MSWLDLATATLQATVAALAVASAVLRTRRPPRRDED